MPVIRFPDRLGFGTDVLVSALLARLVGDGTGYRELLRSRGYQSEKTGATFEAGEWPGAPVPLEWDSGPRGYPLSPETRLLPAVRLRRLIADAPARAIVVGCTYREEGYLVDGMLRTPKRSITVLEVALAVRSGRARIVLAHPNDVQPVPRPRR